MFVNPTPDSYLIQWFDASKQYFPSGGVQVTVYMTDLDYRNELDKIEGLLNKFENSTDIIKSVDSWYPSMKNFFNNRIGLSDGEGVGIPDRVLDSHVFNNYTSLFLFSFDGITYGPNFYIKPTIRCGEIFENISMTTFSFVHSRFNGPSEHIPAMNRVKDLIREQKFSKNVFALAAEYSNWETDEIIDKELYRNLGISMACVFVTTLILLADILASVEVMMCVLMTLVDVMGYMHFWGLTIDVVSSIIVIISIGLCVDYSAHIAHTFLTTEGSRKERTIATVQNIGPAVLNGGFSTFLALVLLATSKSHVFSSFFKVFFLVIFFGLFHGLIFFPAFLSIFGPRPYHKHNEESTKEKGKPNQQTKF